MGTQSLLKSQRTIEPGYLSKDDLGTNGVKGESS